MMFITDLNSYSVGCFEVGSIDTLSYFNKSLNKRYLGVSSYYPVKVGSSDNVFYTVVGTKEKDGFLHLVLRNNGVFSYNGIQTFSFSFVQTSLICRFYFNSNVGEDSLCVVHANNILASSSSNVLLASFSSYEECFEYCARLLAFSPFSLTMSGSLLIVPSYRGSYVVDNSGRFGRYYDVLGFQPYYVDCCNLDYSPIVRLLGGTPYESTN